MALAFLHNKRPGVAVVPHSHDYTFKKVVIAPTCDAWGYTMNYCKCGEAEHSNPVQNLDHDFSGKWHSDESGHWHICSRCGIQSDVIEHTPGVEATSNHPQTCIECGYIIVPALCTHEWGDWELVSQATCTEAGRWQKTCPLCGSYEFRSIPALGHDMVSTVTKEPSCVSKGERYYYCSRCGESYTTEIEKTAHTVEKVNAIPATCTVAGSTEGSRCSVCSNFLVEPQTILPYHIPSDFTYARLNSQYHQKTQLCTRCGETLSSTREPHTWMPTLTGAYCSCGAITTLQ